MIVSNPHLRAASAAALSGVLLVTLQPDPAMAHVGPPAGIREFMASVARIESGGNYQARNHTSGAYGKYQIMPANWPVWAGQYLGDSKAPRTAGNQEKVARAKFIALHRWLGSWRRVAYWWLTGRSNSEHSGWSPIAKWYVRNIMFLYERATGGNRANVRPTRVTTGWLYARNGATAASRIVGFLKPGTRFDILASRRASNGRTWYQVKLGGGTLGWLSSRYTALR